MAYTIITGPPLGPVLFCSWAVGRRRAGRVSGRADDTTRRASTITSRYGNALLT